MKDSCVCWSVQGLLPVSVQRCGFGLPGLVAGFKCLGLVLVLTELFPVPRLFLDCRSVPRPTGETEERSGQQIVPASHQSTHGGTNTSANIVTFSIVTNILKLI